MNKKTNSVSFTIPLPYIPGSEFGTLVTWCGLLALLEGFFRWI